jgi:hypothetical protein
MYKETQKCRICKSDKLESVLSLGEQYLTGVFPKNLDDKITKGPLDLTWCKECGLLQLKHSYSLDEMYGDNYGYRSGLNNSMVKHLTNKIKMLEKMISLTDNDLVIDIGSNDATSLRAYSGKHKKVGIDPTGMKFREFYTSEIVLIPDFFNEKFFKDQFPNQKAKIITSISMFYDLEDPNEFVKDIFNCLDQDGVWHFEQSYMPSMLRTNSYDTICHEHLEFYSFKVIKQLLEKHEMKVIDVQMNSINGGSFAITAAKSSSKLIPNNAIINWMLKQEENLLLDTIKPYNEFKERIFNHRNNLIELVEALVADGKKVFGYGASTKGNVLLQFCNFTKEQIPFIAEVNNEKFGCFTPGTNIPIISEEEAKKLKPDYFLVLPWHFRNSIIEREQEFIERGGKFIFPLPEIEII